ncbi:hypothetical protein Xsto_03935 [Xenorhabdus stockiae]|uniref:Uncharacterized protein n=1 Tax=Xenorhabdus stockiae TaxID=351614 RepID=A0A2D0KAL3_9GAMM|nr:hypothetical protein [Xenorhabdus stockiae]PHM60504.1 hypothetical protein Xsto_03935 [Xenorhabdus stockiae]
MNNKKRKNGLFRGLVEDFFWSNILAVSIIIWGVVSVSFFFDSWDSVFPIGSFIIIVFYFASAYFSSKKKG